MSKGDVMSRKDIILKLQEIFIKVFKTGVTIEDSTSAMDIDNWDSLNHISLLAAIEEEFSIKFTIKEMRSIFKVGDLLDIIESKK